MLMKDLNTIDWNLLQEKHEWRIIIVHCIASVQRTLWRWWFQLQDNYSDANQMQ